MKVVFGLMVIFSLFIVFSLTSDAFADITIVPVAGSDTPGCESLGCYSPTVVVVDVGDKITFSNTDSTGHTFTAGNNNGGVTGEFDTGLLVAGNSYSYTPNFSGNIRYFCMVHPWMHGLIMVKEVSSEEDEFIPQDVEFTSPCSVQETGNGVLAESCHGFNSNGIASFVDQTKDPQSYVDKYNNELAYKEWFDKNYPEYTIYDAVGLPTPKVAEIKELDLKTADTPEESKFCFLFWCW